MTEYSDALEHHYRRLLAFYPRDYRSRYGDEMLDVLLADTHDHSGSVLANSMNLVFGAVLIRGRRIWSAGDASSRDFLAIVSLLAPLLLTAGVASDAHEVAWFLWYGGPVHVPVDLWAWLAWPVVLLLGLLGWRRLTIVGAWLACAALFVFTTGVLRIYTTGFSFGAFWNLLALLGAVSATGSTGMRRGLRLVGRLRFTLVTAAIVTVIFARVLGHHYTVVSVLAWTFLIVVTILACHPRTADGQRAALLLAIPAVSTVLAIATLFLDSPRWLFSVGVISIALYYAVPLLLAATAYLIRRATRHIPPTVNRP